MNRSEALPVLEQLFGLLCRSLPAYLSDARALGWHEGERIWMAVDRLVADQRLYAQRVAEAISDRGGRPHPGRFPTEFGAKNDLSPVFLLGEVIDAQREAIGMIERCAAALENESPLHALAEEILGNAKGHLEILTGMMKAE
jgi:hypothetical protein